MLMYPTGISSQSPEEESEHPIEFQLIGSLEAKGCRGLLKMDEAALEENQVSNCDFTAPSPPKAASSQTCARRDLDA